VSLVVTGAVRSQDAPPPVEPGRLNLEAVSANQQLATEIAARLRGNAHLRHYRVDVSVRDGVAELSGQVADQSQREEVLKTVQAVPGVERVSDRLTLPAGVAVVTVQATAPPVNAGAAGAFPPEPLPIFSAHGGRGMPDPHLQPPPLPPYAWPTYAPYNNVSRVAYPTLYPHEAFPFIGPMHPFPKATGGTTAKPRDMIGGAFVTGNESVAGSQQQWTHGFRPWVLFLLVE
jgi:hypothetical protein